MEDCMHTKLYSKIFLLSCATLAGLTMTGCGKKGQGMPQMGPAEVAVITAQPQRVTVTTELPGRTSAFLIAEVRPQVNGIVQKTLFTEGGKVKEGDLLYQIESSSYKAAYDNAIAALERSEASLPPIKLRTERYQALLAEKAVGQQEYDETFAAMKQVEADIKYWKTVVESARINLEHTKVTAPISGRTGKSNITTGALATAHQGIPFTTIQQIDPIYVDVLQSNAELLQLQNNLASGKMKNSQRTRVKLLLEDGTTYASKGTVQFSDISVNPDTGSVVLRILFPNPKHQLLPGMFVRAVLEEGTFEKAFLIPQQAVQRDPKGTPSVLTVNQSSLVEPKVVTIEKAIGNKWLVSAGIKAGDAIIMEGVQRAQPGSPVKAVPFTATPSVSMPTAR